MTVVATQGVPTIGAFAGAGLIMLFMWWTSAVDWAVDIGGKSFSSIPAFVPVTFEVGGYPTPASLLAPKAVQMADGQLFHVLTYGQNNMPSYAAQVGREDRWRVIAYLWSLQGRKP